MTKSLAHNTAGTTRNCCRCLQDFPAVGNERVCQLCHAPKPKLEHSVLGKPLSPREAQVVELVERGLLNKQIACDLHLTEGTIKQYLFEIFEKTGYHNRVQLAVWSFASRHGFAV